MERVFSRSVTKNMDRGNRQNLDSEAAVGFPRWPRGQVFHWSDQVALRNRARNRLAKHATALQAVRAAGRTSYASYYEARLPEARAIRDQLIARGVSTAGSGLTPASPVTSPIALPQR
jgi:hypothetical protein